MDAIEQEIRDSLQESFGAEVEARRFNSVSVRVGIISDRFRGLSRIDREAIVNPLIEQLSTAAQDEITMLILLTPQEHARRFERMDVLDIEFDEPLPARR